MTVTAHETDDQLRLVAHDPDKVARTVVEASFFSPQGETMTKAYRKDTLLFPHSVEGWLGAWWAAGRFGPGVCR